jgi:hypothetical protein
MDLSTVLSLVGIALALLSFIVSPEWIQSILKKTILSNRQKRIASLKDEYDTRVDFIENRDAWIAALIASVSSALSHLTILIFWVAVYTISLIRKPEIDMIFSFNGLMTFLFLFTPFDRFNSATKLYNDVAYIEKYKNDVIAKLEKLGLSKDEATRLLDKKEKT